MIFSTNGTLSQAPSKNFIKNSCVEIARDWFNWNDETTSPRSLIHFDRYIPSIAKNKNCVWYADWQIARELLDDIPKTRFINRTSLSDGEYQLAYCNAMFPGRTVMCGLDHPNQRPLPVEAAIFECFVNFQSIPTPYFNTETRCYGTTYPELPTAFVIDVDEHDKDSLFPKLWDHHCYQIFDAHDISPPAAIVINPQSMNAHYQFLMDWTAEDKRNTTKAMARYNAIRKNLTLLFGGDVEYQNGGTRTPWFLSGHHRLNPKQKTNSKHRIDVSCDPICHFSIGYELKKYTLDELEALIETIKTLLGPDKVALAYSLDTSFLDHLSDMEARRRHNTTPPTSSFNNTITPAAPATTAKPQRKRTSCGGGLSFAEQLEYAAIPVNQIVENHRDKYLFSMGALHGRDLAAHYQATGDRAAFREEVQTYLAHVNTRLVKPLTAAEVRKTAKL